MFNSRKLKKLFKSPNIFARDFLNKKYPVIRNEINCPEGYETIIINQDLKMENICAVNFPVDVVFTWVDDKDPVWKNKCDHFKGVINEDAALYSRNSARFCDHNEIEYSIKCVLKYLPWVRFIYLITDGQNPRWLNEELNEKIRVIDHKEIIPGEYLPTFNSHVIEAYLFKIEDLSENFLYFNDDVFVARPLPVEHFFRSNGIASLFVSQKRISEMFRKGGRETPTMHASLAGQRLLFDKFSQVADFSLVHTYVPLKKSSYEECWRVFHKEILSFLPNKFRTNKDLNMATFLVPWFSYFQGKSFPVRDICYYFNIRSPAAIDYFMALSNAKRTSSLPHSFCANDFYEDGEMKNEAEGLLKKYFFESV